VGLTFPGEDGATGTNLTFALGATAAIRPVALPAGGESAGAPEYGSLPPMSPTLSGAPVRRRVGWERQMAGREGDARETRITLDATSSHGSVTRH